MKDTIRFGDFVEVNPRIRLERGKEYPYVEMADVIPGIASVLPKRKRVYKGSGSRFQSGDTLFARITPDRRADTEGLSEEELAVFDLLTRHEPHLTEPEQEEVKTAARKLLELLKREKLVLDWRKRTTASAQVRTAIDEMLDQQLPQKPYTDALFLRKSEAVYRHIYDSYYGDGKSIYTGGL